jgi:hypothetical protein
MKKPFLAFLDITSYVDIGSIGAEHYYGKVKFPRELNIENIDIQHPLSAKEALYLNKKCGVTEYSRYRAGELSNKFETKDELIRFSAKWFKTNYPENLLCLDNCKHLIYWPKSLDSFAEKVNNVANEYEKLTWLRKGYYFVCSDENLEHKLSREWWGLMNEYYE